MDGPKFKILQSPSLKRKQRVVPIAERVKLERVLGLTIASNAALSVDRNTGTIAYPAGCVVILYNPKKGKQTHIFNASRKTLTCLAFSGDGRHLVTGESGHQPAVRVWSLDDNTQVAEFLGHKYGISCVAFSPNLKYIVSIGTQHDMIVNVWNWKTNIKVASNKVASKVTDVAFSEDGSMFVTVGNRHVKFWYLDASKSKIKTETLPLQGRNGILGEHQNNFFCGVRCGKGQMANSVYAITESGLLCEFDQKRLLVKWVSLKTDRAFAVCLGEQYIFIGCDGGLVRVFSAKTLNFLATLPLPHHLGVDVSVGLLQSDVTSPDNSRFPDTVAVQYDDVNNRLSCVYNDHSLYVWDVTDVRKVAKTRSFLFHSGAIWGVDVYPNVGNSAMFLPPGSFATCSSDNTIRIWNCSANMSTETPYKRNIYCNELLKVLYLDPDLNNLLDIAYNPAGKTDKTDMTFQEKIGIRSVRFSPNGRHLASGDRAGNIRVHDLSTMRQIAKVEAHDSEVLCLEYTRPSTGVNLLATASRDRLLHVFDVDHTYGLVQTLDEHSSAITAVKFAQLEGQLLMLSCGADKSLLFRNAQMDPEFRFVLNRHLVSRTTLYDMEIDASGKFVATACQDRNIRIYNTRTGKQKKCYSGSSGTEGTLLRVELDPSGRYAATSCSDKNLSIYDFFAGELVASMFGHSEISPGIKFLNDFKHIISISVDGCIFIWRLPSEFTESMISRIGEKLSSAEEQQDGSSQAPHEACLEPTSDSVDFPDANRNFPPSPFTNLLSPPSSDSDGQFYRFSVGQLPAWAKPRVQPGVYEKSSTPINVPSNIALPKGKWARDVDSDTALIKPIFNLKLNEENRTFDLPPSLIMQAKVPIIDDDELNQDNEVEDEFSPNKTVPAFSSRLQVGPKLEQEISDTSSNSVDEDEGETNETLYYMPNATFDSDPSAIDSTFLVQENDIGNMRESFGSDMISAGEEEDTDQLKSPPCTPTKSSVESGVVSLDKETVVGGTFERLYKCNETFAETMKRLEDKMTERFDSEKHFQTGRNSISSLFLDKSSITSLTSGQEQQVPVQPPSMPKEFSVKFVDEGKRNLNDVRDLKPRDSSSTGAAGGGGGARRQGRSIGGEPKPTFTTEKSSKKWNTGSSATKASPSRKWKSMHDVSGLVLNPTTSVPSQPTRSKTPTLSLQQSCCTSISPVQSARTETQKHSIVRQLSDNSSSSSSRIPMPRAGKQESKVDTVVAYATLPKTKGRPVRQSANCSAVVTSAGAVPKTLQSGFSQNLPCEPDSSSSSLSSQPKLKPVARTQSYRMQTESSMAKLSSADASQSRAASRKSAPLPQTDKYQSAPNLLDASETVGDSGIGATSKHTTKDRVVTVTMARQFSPVLEIDSEAKSKLFLSGSSDSSHFSSSMLTTSMPSGILDKISDRDPVPPSSAVDIPTSMHSSFVMKSKNRLSWAPEIPISRTKTVVFEKEHQVKLDLGAGTPNCENLDISPFDVPVRDLDYPSKRSDAKLPLTAAKSVATLGRLTIAPVQKSMTAVNASAGIAEEKSPAVSSPKFVRINRRASPPRPHSVGPSDDHHGSTHRRFLPADPQATGEATRDQSTSQESGATMLLTFRPETVEDSAPTNCASGETATVTSRSSAGNQSTPSSSSSQGKSGGAAFGRSSPFKMLLSSEKDSKTTWVKKAQQMQQQWEQRHQRKGSDAREIDLAGKSCSDVVSVAERNDEELRREKRTERQSQKTSKFSPPEKISLDTSVFGVTPERSCSTNRAEQRGSRPNEYSPYLRSRSMSSDANMTALPRPSLQANEPLSISKKREIGFVPASTTNNSSLEVLLHRQRHQQLISTNSDNDEDVDDDDIPREGEPDTMGTLDNTLSRAAKSRIMSINSTGNCIKTAAVSSNLHDETEKQCAQVASELTEAVTKARQMHTQLSNDSLYDGTTNSHDRALKLLRETMCEAKDQLTQALDIAPAPSVYVQTLAADPRMVEMLDCFSQKLYDLYKKKLEND